MKNKYKQAAELISNVVKYEFIECSNNTFKAELEKKTTNNGMTLSVVKTKKEIEACKNGYILLSSKKPLVFGLMELEDYYIKKIANCTLPTPNSYLFEKIEII